MKQLLHEKLLTVLCVLFHVQYCMYFASENAVMEPSKREKSKISFFFHSCNYHLSIPAADSISEITFLLLGQL